MTWTLVFTISPKRLKVHHNTQLSKSDPLVSKAMQCFESAFEFSEGTNVQALYDLALMYRHVGDLDKALELLEELREVNRERLNYLSVNAFEQAGLILTEKSEAEKDDQKKKQLAAEAESMFYRALEKAVLLYSRNPTVQGHISEVWHSFLKILKTIDDCPDLCVTEKLIIKAEHFLKMSDTKQSKELLDQLQQLPAEGDEKRQTLKLTIELYRQTEEFEKALALLKILNSTPEGRATMADVLEDSPQYEQQLHLGAAMRALHNNALADSRYHFHAAFTRAFTQHPSEDSSSSDSDSSEGDPETWDVMVLYNRRGTTATQSEQGADALNKVLRKACGLKVTVMDKDVLLGRPVLDSMVRVMRRSGLVLVLAGEGKLCSELKLISEHAARRKKSTTVILFTGGSHVPRALQTCRSMTCPVELLSRGEELASQTSRKEPASQTSCQEPVSQTSCQEPSSCELASRPTGAESAERYSEETVRAICKVFRFLVGL